MIIYFLIKNMKCFFLGPQITYRFQRMVSVVHCVPRRQSKDLDTSLLTLYKISNTSNPWTLSQTARMDG